MAENTLYIRERGKGKSESPLVLIHGFPFDSSLWEKQLDALGDEIWLVAPDMPGMGRSAPLDGDRETGIDAYASAIAGWAESEGIEKIGLAGHSMGGYIAFAFARLYPQMLDRLILVATKATADTEAAKEGRYKIAAGVEEKGAVVTAEGMLPKLFAPATYDEDNALVESIRGLIMKQQKRGIIDCLYAMASRPDSTPDLARIKVPTLIVSGAQDAIIPGSEADTMHQGIAGSRHVIIEDGGHMLMLEDPRAFNKAVREFVAGSR